MTQHNIPSLSIELSEEDMIDVFLATKQGILDIDFMGTTYLYQNVWVNGYPIGTTAVGTVDLNQLLVKACEYMRARDMIKYD